LNIIVDTRILLSGVLIKKKGVEIEGSFLLGTEAGDCDAATGTLIQKAGVARECRSPPSTSNWLSRVIHSLGKGSLLLKESPLILWVSKPFFSYP